MKIPDNLRYAKTDEWAKLEGNIAIIGISDFAQDQLSDIVYVEFNKDVDESFKKDEVLTTIESVKAAGEVNAPFSGKVLEINNELSNKPETLNEDPYEKGWIIKIEMSDPSEFQSLMTAQEYIKFCEGRH